VSQVFQQLQTLSDDVVAFSALDVGDETDAAGVVFVARVVQTLLGGYSVAHFFTSVRHSASGENPILIATLDRENPLVCRADGCHANCFGFKMLIYLIIAWKAGPTNAQMVREYRESGQTFQAFACNGHGETAATLRINRMRPDGIPQTPIGQGHLFNLLFTVLNTPIRSAGLEKRYERTL
jgi:hypothetical protein